MSLLRVQPREAGQTPEEGDTGPGPTGLAAQPHLLTHHQREEADLLNSLLILTLISDSAKLQSGGGGYIEVDVSINCCIEKLVWWILMLMLTSGLCGRHLPG